MKRNKAGLVDQVGDLVDLPVYPRYLMPYPMGMDSHASAAGVPVSVKLPGAYLYWNTCIRRTELHMANIDFYAEWHVRAVVYANFVQSALDADLVHEKFVQEDTQVRSFGMLWLPRIADNTDWPDGMPKGLMYRHYSEGQSLVKDWLYYTDKVVTDG